MEKVRRIPIDDITPDPNQPRRRFIESNLQELAASIKDHGLIQPITVRKNGNGFMVVSGERRWRASKLSGCSSIRALVINENETKVRLLSILENIQRKDLNPIEESDAFEQLLPIYGSEDGIAKALGKGVPYIRERLRLQALSEAMREALILGVITLPQALHLSKVSHDHQMVAFKKASQMNSKEWGRMVEAMAEIEQQTEMFTENPADRAEKKKIMGKYDSLMEKVEDLVRRSFKKDEVSMLSEVFDGDSGLRADRIDVVVKHLLMIRDALKRAKATQQSIVLMAK